MKTRALVTWISESVLAANLAFAAVAQDTLKTSLSAGSSDLVVPAAGSTYVSGWLADMIKLARAGIEESVLVPFIDSAGVFNLDADTIIYLHDLGVSSEVIATMMRHDQDLMAGVRQPHPFVVPSTRPEIANLLGYFDKPKASVAPQATADKAAAESAVSLSSKAASGPLAIPEPPTSVSIVVESGSPDVFAEFAASELGNEDTPPGTLAATRAPAGWAAPALASSRYPVREPYPVRLTNTVVMIRATGRQPNLMIIEVSR